MIHVVKKHKHEYLIVNAKIVFSTIGHLHESLFMSLIKFVNATVSSNNLSRVFRTAKVLNTQLILAFQHEL